MASQQGRRELGDRSVFFFHPPTPSCQDSSITGGYVAGRRATEKDAGGHFQHPASEEVAEARS
jgi:hypothetical protein